MKKYIGFIKIHYINYKGEEGKETILSHVYSLKEFQEAVSLYSFLKENEIDCCFNDHTDEVPQEWGSGCQCEVTVDDLIVTLGNDGDLWILDVYVK